MVSHGACSSAGLLGLELADSSWEKPFLGKAKLNASVGCCCAVVEGPALNHQNIKGGKIYPYVLF